MPSNMFKARGSTNASKPTAGGANIYTTPVLGVVKDNIDPTRTGRLRVYISDFSGLDPDDADNWIIVRYMSNFFGYVRPTSSSDNTDYGTFKRNPSSYGEWHAPPDIGTTVVCIFVNGDINYGFYIGAVPESELLHMVPAIGSSFPDQNESVTMNDQEAVTYGGSPRLPVTNMNTNNDAITNTSSYITSAKPVHSYTASIMEQQGIIRDPIRGPISSSAQRESSSRVGWGVSTPGRPIYEGGFTDEDIVNNLTPENDKKLRIISRRGGHSIVMDDGDIIGRDQLVRIRTAQGHQILMSDDGQTLMILHSNGQSYVELGKEGTVDVYATNSINLRTHGDLNLHADNNLNIHAAKDLNIHAENMNVTTKKSLKQSIGENWITSALGLITAKTTGAMSLRATGSASLASSGVTFINGSIVNLNTGRSPVIPPDVSPATLTAHTDTLFDQQKGFIAAPGKLLSVTSRAPAHAPWAHAGQGVDVKVDLSGGASTGGRATAALSSAVSAGLSTASNPTRLATSLSSPVTRSISNTLDTSATSALVGLTGQSAASGPLAPAINKGAAVVNVGASKVAAVGAFAQTPSQMASAGILKPGSDRLINSLVNSGANIDHAMSSSLFSGTAGAETLQGYTKSITTQTSTVVTNLRQTQTTLTNTGVITGNESADQIAGVVYSGTKSGVSNTIATVKTTVNKTTPDQTVIKDIGEATTSVRQAETTMGGMGGIAKAVEAMVSSPTLSNDVSLTSGSVTDSAFNAISGSFPTFMPNQPVNLAKAVNEQKIVSATLTGVTGQITSDIASNLTPDAINTGAAAITSKYTGTSLLESTNIASGLINIPGGLSSIASVSDKAAAITNIPNAEQISSLVNSAATSSLNGISNGLSGLGGKLTSSLTSIGSIAGAFSAISSVKSLFGGKGGVRAVSVAVNTTNRTPLKSKTRALLGDPGIPEPNFSGEVSQQAIQALANRNSTQTAIKLKNDEISDLSTQIDQLKQEGRALLLAERSAPAGDPVIKRKKAEIETKIKNLSDERENITKEVERLKNNLE